MPFGTDTGLFFRNKIEYTLHSIQKDNNVIDPDLTPDLSVEDDIEKKPEDTIPKDSNEIKSDMLDSIKGMLGFTSSASPPTLAPGLTSYPSQQDALYGIKQQFGYGSSNEPYINDDVASVKTEGLKPDVDSMLNSKSENKDLTKLSNLDLKSRLNTMFAQGALAANRSAIAGLGFNGRNLSLSTDIPATNIAGLYDKKTDNIWLNSQKDEIPSIVHESIHRGLQHLRNESPEAKEILTKLPGEEYIVRYLMATKMGDPENTPQFEERMKQRNKALEDFKDPEMKKRLDTLEKIAEEVYKSHHQSGPH